MKARILLVEDNQTNLDLMTYLLSALGYEVACERDGVAGLDRARGEPFELVLCDILMPYMDGLEFARRFKSDASLARTPLVAVTALAMNGDRERISAAGFDGYISKPIDPQQFAKQIESYVRESRSGEGAGR
jgi:two-component system, cell cycle response regulator